MSSKKRGPQLTVVGGNGRMRNVRPAGARSRVAVEDLPSRVYFSRASSTPTGTSLTTLWLYARWLAHSPRRKLFVLGHANRRLWPTSSRGLADARARAVCDLLVWLGARAGQVRVVKPSRLHRLGPETMHRERKEHRSVELITVPARGHQVQMARPRRTRASRSAASLSR